MGGLGGDNMTIIIICCLHGKPWEHLVEKCKKYHAEKKAMSKLHEPAFSTFDRFAADGPFSEVIKGVDDSQNANETSSSSHTSSPSSSPISAEDKFDGLVSTEPTAKPENDTTSNIDEKKTPNDDDQDLSKHSTPLQIASERPSDETTTDSADTASTEAPTEDTAVNSSTDDSNVASESAVSSTD
jgi:hypothetical protein